MIPCHTYYTVLTKFEWTSIICHALNTNDIKVIDGYDGLGVTHSMQIDRLSFLFPFQFANLIASIKLSA